MKRILISLLLPGLLTFISCSSKSVKEEQKNPGVITVDSQKISMPKTPPPGGAPVTTIHANRSEILAEFIEKRQKDQSGFSIVARTLEVKEDPAFPSIATAHNIYELFPNFVLGEKKEITDSQKNKKLMQLKDLKRGDRFKAIIFLDDNRRWMIQEIID